MEIPAPPSRIISLVPSITELVCHLGAKPQVAGVTKFCVHPEGLTLEKVVVGGTKNVDQKKAAALKPDLILASKEENVQDQIEALANRFPIYVSDVIDLASAQAMIRDVALLCGKDEAGAQLNLEIDNANECNASPTSPLLKVGYLIWKRPFMVAGGDSFISSMLTACGLQNAFQEMRRYPMVSIEDFAVEGCDFILLSSEPYPFKEADRAELERLSGIPCRLVDGEAFSWYGSRIPKGLHYGNLIAAQLGKR